MKALWKRYPGALTVSTLEKMQTTVVTQWATLEPRLQLVATAVQPVLEDGSGPQNEWAGGTRNINVVFHPGPRAAAADVVTQRLKA